MTSLALPIPHIWVPRYLRIEEGVKASGLVNGGRATKKGGLVDAGVIRVSAGGLDIPNPVAFWNMDAASGANEVDVVSGTLTLVDNNTVGTTTGKVDGARTTNGTSSFLSLADNSTVSMTGLSGGFTVGFWAYQSSFDAGGVVAKANANFPPNDLEYWFEVGGTNSISFNMSEEGTNTRTASGGNNSFTSGSWHCVIGWYNDTDHKPYIQVDNATPGAGSAIPSPYYRDGTSPLWVGKYHANIDVWSAVYIDNLAIWKEVLSSDARTNFYNAGAGATFNGTIWV